MTEAHVICALFALPFLTLALAWAAGMAALEHYERRAIRKLKAIIREPMK